MDDFLAAWIIVQLAVYGFLTGSLHNDMYAGEHECATKSEWPLSITMILPISIWMADNTPSLTKEVEEYCHPVDLNQEPKF